MPLQILHGFGLLVFNDGQLIAALELIVIQQVTGHQIIKNRPELSKRVFHGGSGQGETSGGLKLLNGFGDQGIGVFNILGFVQNTVLERMVLVIFKIPFDEAIRSYSQIAGIQRL